MIKKTIKAFTNDLDKLVGETNFKGKFSEKVVLPNLTASWNTTTAATSCVALHEATVCGFKREF